MGVMEQPVAEGIRDGRVAYLVVPLISSADPLRGPAEEIS